MGLYWLNTSLSSSVSSTWLSPSRSVLEAPSSSVSMMLVNASFSSNKSCGKEPRWHMDWKLSGSRVRLCHFLTALLQQASWRTWSEPSSCPRGAKLSPLRCILPSLSSRCPTLQKLSSSSPFERVNPALVLLLFILITAILRSCNARDAFPVLWAYLTLRHYSSNAVVADSPAVGGPLLCK